MMFNIEQYIGRLNFVVMILSPIFGQQKWTKTDR